MIELQDWLRYREEHGLLFSFEGLTTRAGKGDFHSTVSEAAACNESYLQRRQEEEYNYYDAEFDKAVADKDDREEILSRFCDYLGSHVTVGDWPSELKFYESWALAPIEAILAVVQAFQKSYKDDYTRNWCVSSYDALAGDLVEDRAEDEEYLLKEYQPKEVWSHASEEGIPVADVFFVCPSCRGEPQTEEGLRGFHGEKNGLPNFYCGSCGSEAHLGEHENLLDFFTALAITPYPFNPEKQALWKLLMATREALGRNKLGLSFSEVVHLKITEERPSSQGGTWTNYVMSPGELVRVTGIHGDSFTYENVDADLKPTGDAGGTLFEHVWGRPVAKEAPG